MEATYRAQRDINPEDGLENIYNTTAGQPAHAGQICAYSSQVRPEPGPNVIRKFSPSVNAATASQTSHPVFGYVRSNLGTSVI